MDVIETQTSRENQFIKLVQKHYPKVQVQRMVNGLYFLTPDRLFHPSQSMFRVHKKNQEAWLFRDGIWVPIDIYVYNEEFFALAQTIGKEYTEATNQPVRIIKEF